MDHHPLARMVAKGQLSDRQAEAARTYRRVLRQAIGDRSRVRRAEVPAAEYGVDLRRWFDGVRADVERRAGPDALRLLDLIIGEGHAPSSAAVPRMNHVKRHRLLCAALDAVAEAPLPTIA